MVRVRDVSNPDGDRRDHLSTRIRDNLSRRIAGELQRRETHEQLREQRFAARRAAEASSGTATEHVEDLILPAAFDEAPPVNSAAPAAPDTPRPTVRSRDISLIEVTEDSSVRARIFPRSVHCLRCGHFLILNPERPPTTLVCPCCKDGQLVVEPIVFICARCATVRELLPPGEKAGTKGWRRRRRLEEALGLAPTCPDCQQGHIHLQKHGTNSISRWQWECVNCNHFQENVPGTLRSLPHPEYSFRPSELCLHAGDSSSSAECSAAIGATTNVRR